MDYIDLRDLEDDELRKWKKAFKEQVGDDFESQLENESTMIPDCEFKEYAQQLADDIGAIDDRQGWPLNCIDWDYAVQELKMDYSSIEVDGIEYWFRSF